MEGWKFKKLGDVCATIQDGAHESPQKQFAIPGEGRFLYITSKNIRMNYMDLSDVAYVDQDFHGRIYPRCQPRVGDVLLTKDGSNTGNVALNTIDAPFSLLSSVCLIKTVQSELKPAFLCYYLQSPQGLANIIGQMSGAAIKRIILRDVKLATVPLPPIPEQQRIVGILDAAFAGLAIAKANAEQNLQNARALFETQLKSIFDQGSATSSQKRLAEISLEFGRGKSRHRPRNDPKLYGGPYPFIQTGDLSNTDHWLRSHTQTYSEIGLVQSRLWPRGTICIAIVGATVGETAILDFQACFPDSVIGIVVNDVLADNEYVEFLLQSFKSLLKEKGKGTARDNINLGTFEDQTFPFPSLPRQKEIVAMLNGLRAETQRLEAIYDQKLSALDDLKKSLLHQAFTGQLTAA